MLLYNILVRLYYLIIYVISAFLKKARLFIDGRKTIYSPQLCDFKVIKKPAIWFHFSSMGEYEDGRKLVEQVYKTNTYKILITFSSPSGFEYYKEKLVDYCVSYLPYDTKKQMNAFMEFTKPAKIILCRNDLWPNLIYSAAKKKIPLYLIDYTINSKLTSRFPFNKFYKLLFSKFTWIFVQNENTQNLLVSHFSQRNISLAGNTRFDALEEDCGKEDDHLRDFINGMPVLIFGSALKNDLRLLQTLNSNFKQKIRLIIVEHEPSLKSFRVLQNKMDWKMLLYSELKNNSESLKEFNLLYVDTIGILKQLYFHSHLAFIGGGFNSIGIHNILEPAIAGNFIAFGPNHRNYTEALELLNKGQTRIIRTVKDLEEWIALVLINKGGAIRNKEYVLERKGASAICYKHIFGHRPDKALPINSSASLKSSS